MQRNLCILLFLVSTTVWAEVPEMTRIVIIQPGGAGSTAAAQKVMEQFSETLRAIAHKPVQSVYFPDENSGKKFIDTARPQLGIVSVAFYVKYRRQYGLQLQLQVRQNDSLERRYLAVVPENSAIRSLEQLRRHKVASNHLYEPHFLSLVFFGDKETWSKHYQLKATQRPYTAARRMFRGRYDAIVLDTIQWESMSSLFARRGKKLRIVARSQSIPMNPVVSFGKADPRVLKALSQLQHTAKGKKVLQLFGMQSFTKVNRDAFSKLEQSWDGAK